MNNLLKWLVSHLGLQTVEEIVLPMELSQLEGQSHDTIVRICTVPEAIITAACAKTGADSTVAEAKFRAAAEAMAEAFLSLAPNSAATEVSA